MDGPSNAEAISASLTLLHVLVVREESNVRQVVLARVEGEGSVAVREDDRIALGIDDGL